MEGLRNGGYVSATVRQTSTASDPSHYRVSRLRLVPPPPRTFDLAILPQSIWNARQGGVKLVNFILFLEEKGLEHILHVGLYGRYSGNGTKSMFKGADSEASPGHDVLIDGII